MAPHSLVPVTESQPFARQVVVFAGKLSSLSRAEAQQLVERLGGSVDDRVTARTTIVVIGELRRGEQRIASEPGTPEHVEVISEDEFCRRAGVPSTSELRRQFYRVRDVRAMYPAVREDHLRYLEKWGLITPVARTRTDRYYDFSDLLVIKQASAQLEQGTPMRAVLRSLMAARNGQLAFDFRPVTDGAAHARVIALERKEPAAERKTVTDYASDPQEALAAKYFVEAASIDDAGDAEKQEQAATAYRKALVIDPDLVPAIVNLANIHYGRDELIEAQALYERAIILDPECFEAHFNLGNIHHDLGRYDDALVCYRDAVALNNSYPEAHFYLAVTLEKMGHSPEAKPHWKMYQRLAPDGEWVDLAREFSD
ncbi:MAG TPA: tetratricopeptide repeat protein [Vicinamibacterales bacterium]|nr:tetratricopeptide repeat protein [Vicinamibacterales bacterium]